MADAADDVKLDEVPLNRTRLIAGALDVGGAVLILAMILWAVARFWQIAQAATFVGADAAQTVVLTLAGLGMAALFFGAGEALRKIENFGEMTRGGGAAAVQSGGGPFASPTAAQPGDNQHVLNELVLLMREVRDISLLSEEQRSARLRVQADELGRRLEREVPDLLREHKWFEAFKRVRAARERFPSLELWDTLAAQIQAVRSQVESRDIEAATRQITELTALGAWDRAHDVARDLVERHPKAEGAIELARRIRMQRDKAEAEMRAKLMGLAQDYTNKREWIEALAAARTLMQRFPNTTEADALRQQMPILEANAEVKSRQKMESGIRDLLTAKRYGDAVRMARELIARYPNSPQASILHDQLPRLEEKAAQYG